MKWGAAIFLAVTAYVLYKLKCMFDGPLEIPQLPNTWWGKGDPLKEDTSITPFQIKVSDNALMDLQNRLKNTRPFTPPLRDIQQQYGFNTDLLKEILDFWRTKYNWREREKYLNKYPQFSTSIQGLKIRYIHVKPENVPKGTKVLPLLMLHGWPGSVREFYDIIPLLTTPQEGRSIVFEVIAPYLPGFGFSDAAVRPGLGASQVAVVFKNFMERLGFNQFYVQGGDFGSIILQIMSVMYPNKVIGFHSNMCYVNTPLAIVKMIVGSVYPSLIVRKEHEDLIYPIRSLFERLLRETGYFHIQATKPDTIGVGVSDSPIGLAAYILEKFIVGTNKNNLERNDGGLLQKYTYTDLLDNVMIYWFSGSITTSFRLYAETFNKEHTKLGLTRYPIKIPTACARFVNDLYSPDAVLGEIFTNMVQLNDYDGGHFAAFELPQVLASDIFEAITKIEDTKK